MAGHHSNILVYRSVYRKEVLKFKIKGIEENIKIK